MSNRASRKGIGVDRSEFDWLSDVLRKCGVGFDEDERVERFPDLGKGGRRLVKVIQFETTALLFDKRGRYLGREYMARDECDYVTPRAATELKERT